MNDLLFIKRALGGSLDENCHCYTLEVSFFSYQPAGFAHPIPYTEEECTIYKHFYLYLILIKIRLYFIQLMFKT